MAKVGIITFHKVQNYGAVLQVYCLQEYLHSKGFDVVVLDYFPAYFSVAWHPFSITNWISKSPKKTIARLLTEPFLCVSRIKRFNNFRLFVHANLFIQPFSTLEETSKELDYLILGSDQIWSPAITGGFFDPVLWGTNANCKVITYAASTRLDKFTSKQSDFIKRHIGNLSNISVREGILKELLQNYTDKTITIVSDPTILAGKQILERIAQHKYHKRKYLLVYEVDYHSETYKMAKELASKLNVTIIELTGRVEFKNVRKRDQSASPEEFLGYIMDAACILTTSFHGMALSVIFHKMFYAVKQNNSADERIASLLNQLGLENHFVEKGEVIIPQEIDYEIVENKIQDLRKISMDYLKNSLM